MQVADITWHVKDGAAATARIRLGKTLYTIDSKTPTYIDEAHRMSLIARLLALVTTTSVTSHVTRW